MNDTYTIIIACAALGGGLTALIWRTRQLGRFGVFPASSERLLDAFRGSAPLTSADYQCLFAYFVHGFVLRRSALGAYADYPGWPSGDGSAVDRHHSRMEGFSRIAPLLGAWLHGGRPPSVRLPDGQSVNVASLLAQGVRAGTDPTSPEYWGTIGHRDSRIVEAADIALALWLARDSVWPSLSDEDRSNIVRWLSEVNGKETVDNNWHLFVVVVDTVLQALGTQFDADERQRRYDRAKSFYRGDGWFSDGPATKFDYYNAWGFHYPLFWTQRIDPSWDKAFLDKVRRDFVTTYKYFFGPHGFPILGRSMCYRMAAPVPLLSAQMYDPDLVSPGEARRALDLTWRHFIRNDALCRGNVTQGYYAADERLLDSYSGPASCLWSLRSLIVVFHFPATSPFWTSSGEPLPVELGDFAFDIPTLGWRIEGTKDTADVRIRIPSNANLPYAELQRIAPRDRLLNFILRRGRRPASEAAKYGRLHYRSARPFFIEGNPTVPEEPLAGRNE